MPITSYFKTFGGKAFIFWVDLMTEDPPNPQLSISMSPESHTAVYTTGAQRSESTVLMQDEWSGIFTH